MSDYAIEKTERIDGAEETIRVEAPTREEAIETYTEVKSTFFARDVDRVADTVLSRIQSCTCDPGEACDACGGERPSLADAWNPGGGR